MKLLKKMSLSQHKTYGFFLKLFTDGVLDLRVSLSKTYGKTSRAAKLADNVWRNVSKLKSHLDDLVCQENPHADNCEVLNIYYGDREWKAFDIVTSVAKIKFPQEPNTELLNILELPLTSSAGLTKDEMFLLLETLDTLDLIMRKYKLTREDIERAVMKKLPPDV
ncbi:MAG: hypothetical protein EBE86_023735 [Hormoscilla sp. GUM202]|nr:hypothetical protein [Hormoscilla sp. GUM202]